MREMKSNLRGPDVLGIGAQRAGTTWLHRNLNKHPHIALLPAPLKEVHFFDELHLLESKNRHRKRQQKLTKFASRAKERGFATPANMATIAHLQDAKRDDDWYRRLFTLLPDQHLRGEITPAYGLLPKEGIQHILRISPDIRLILLLRHPVERVWSHVRYTIGRRQRSNPNGSATDTSLEELRALAFSPQNRRRTQYPSIIQRFAVVPAGRLHIDFFDRVITEPRSLLADIAHFLGVDPSLFPRGTARIEQKLNSSPKLPLPPSIAAEIAETYRQEVEWLVANVDGVPNDWLNRVEKYADSAAH